MDTAPPRTAFRGTGFTISAIVLNWNRAALLDKCLASFSATIADFDACFVIDNGSSDDSARVIARWHDVDDRIRPVLKPENRGAEWINEVMPWVTSDLVFILANDKVLLPGWVDYVQAAFTAFPELAQLALHAPAPLDDEVWRTKPARYLYRSGVGLYEALTNTGMSSVLRRSLFSSGEIAFCNIDSKGSIKLPNDGLLTAEIKQRGHLSAWSERYYCLNSGHTIDEFTANPAYYDENYGAKPWLGKEGLAARIALFNSTPKPIRTSRVFGWTGIPECAADPQPIPARLWSILDGGGPELESIEFLFGLARLVKPKAIGLVRGWTGHLAVALATAAADNAWGSVIAFEPDSGLADLIRRKALETDLADRIALARDPAGLSEVDLLIVAGYFTPDDESVLPGIVETAAKTARFVIVQDACLSEAMQRRLKPILERAFPAQLPLPSPRGLTLHAGNRPIEPPGNAAC